METRRKGEEPILIRLTGLALFLLAFWLLLSGHYTPWLTGAGVVSAIVIAALGRRAGYGDAEGFPIDRLPAALLYWLWLLKEIGKSALTVARVVLDPRLPISPRLAPMPLRTRTAVGATTYANSITLTPGTVTVEIDTRRRELVVHALTAAGAEDLAGGDMERRVMRMEGNR